MGVHVWSRLTVHCNPACGFFWRWSRGSAYKCKSMGAACGRTCARIGEFQSADLFFPINEAFDELSLHLRGVCTEQSTWRCYWKVGCATWPLVPALLGFFFRTLEMGSFFHYFTEISTLISQESHEVELFGTRKGWEVCCDQEFEYLLKCPNLLISPTPGLRETQCNQAWGLLIPSSFLCWIKIGSANIQS